MRKPPSGTEFTFVVDDVDKEGWTYDPGPDPPPRDSIIYSQATSDVAYENSLGDAFPSPADYEVWIPFTLSETADVVISIYDADGQLVRTLDLGEKSPGLYLSEEEAAYWDGTDEDGAEVPDDIYFFIMEADYFEAEGTILLIR